MKPNLTQSPSMAPLIIPGDGVHSSANMSRPLRNLVVDWCGISVSRGRSSLALLRMASMETSTVSANPQPLAWRVPTTPRAWPISPNQVASGASDGQLHTCRTDTSRRITLTVKAVWVKENPCLFLLPGHLRLCIAFLSLASTSSCQTEQTANGRRAKYKVSLLLFFHSPLVRQACTFMRVPFTSWDYKYLQLITVKMSCPQYCYCQAALAGNVSPSYPLLSLNHFLILDKSVGIIVAKLVLKL